MQVITIRQPWATLIALGEKEYETRSWQTKYRGKLAIHAGKQIDIEACHDKSILNELNKHGITLISELPTGSIIAIAELTDCLKVSSDLGHYAITEEDRINEIEYAFGDFSEGRYAWKSRSISLWEYPVEKVKEDNLDD